MAEKDEKSQEGEKGARPPADAAARPAAAQGASGAPGLRAGPAGGSAAAGAAVPQDASAGALPADPLAARIGAPARERLRSACVGIAGAGGLGSNIAVMLARSGVGRLRIVDFDAVDASNLNRQHYFRQHLGRPKVDALAEQLRAIDPGIRVDARRERVTAANARALFAVCPIVCEAFDDPEAKALLVDELLSLPDGPVVIAGNGMAGLGPADQVVTRRLGRRLYLCGDGQSDVGAGQVLYAPRVVLCAAQQALLALRLILGQEGRAP